MAESEATNPEPTIESVRLELRNAIAQFAFWGGADKAGGDKRIAAVNRDVAYNLTNFGVNAGLIEREERDEWIAALDGKQVLAVVVVKYLARTSEADEPEPEDEETPQC